MKKTTPLAAAAALTLCLFLAMVATQKNQPPLAVGDGAPLFIAEAIGPGEEHCHPFNFADYRGKRKVVLVFYPLDDTYNCTRELKNLRDHYAALEREGYLVIGINTNSIDSHKAFIDKYRLPFTLLTDTTEEVHNAYKAWEYALFFWKHTRRITYVIDERGIITKVITDVDVNDHAAQILA